MRTFLALCLMLVMCMISLKELVFIGAYQINKEYIAKNLCEKRTIPKSGCNGKCLLSKKIQEANKQQEVPSGTMPRMTQEKVTFFHYDEKYTECIASNVHESLDLPYLMRYSQPFYKVIDHPPNA